MEEEEMALIQRKGVEQGASKDDATSENKPRKNLKIELMVALIVLGSAFVVLSALAHPFTASTSSYKRKPYESDIDKTEVVAKYGNCTLPSSSPPDASNEINPFLLPGYPTSTGYEGPGDVVKPIIAGVTGLKGGAKNYHASSKRLKRCHSKMDNDATATCSTIHPIVGIGPPQRKSLFQDKVILALRNFDTVFPMFLSQKQNKYHGVKGQMSLSAWRNMRDGSYQGNFGAWKNLILEWKDMEGYTIDMYMPYELLLDEEKGPLILEQLASTLEQGGFPIVAQPDDFGCLWYQSVKSGVAFENDYQTFVPAYTREQQKWLTEQMDTFVKEVESDEALHLILSMYRDHIRDTLPIDFGN